MNLELQRSDKWWYRARESTIRAPGKTSIEESVSFLERVYSNCMNSWCWICQVTMSRSSLVQVTKGVIFRIILRPHSSLLPLASQSKDCWQFKSWKSRSDLGWDQAHFLVIFASSFHSQDSHEHRLPHDWNCRQPHHWSRCSSAKNQFNSTSFKMAKFTFNNMVKNNFGLLQESLLFFRFGCSRVSQRLTSGMGNPSTLNSTHRQQIRSLQRSNLRSIQNFVWACHQEKKKTFYFRKLIRRNVSKLSSLSVLRRRKRSHWHTCGMWHALQVIVSLNCSRKTSEAIQLDHVKNKVHGETTNLKIPTFVETVTSMSGAVIVPDLSANPVAVKAFKQFQFIAVNDSKSLSFNVMVIQVFSNVKIKLVENCHFLLKSVHRTVTKVKARLRDLTIFCMVMWDPSGLDLQIIWELIQMSRWSRWFISTLDGATCSIAKPLTRRCSIIRRRSHSSFIAHVQSQSPAPKLQIRRAPPQKSYALRLGEDVITGIRIVSPSDGQVPKTIAGLTGEEQLNITELKKLKVAAHESSAVYQESSHDKMLFQDLVQKFLLQQKKQKKEQAWIFRVGLSGCSFFRRPASMASSVEGATSQSSQSSSARLSESVQTQPPPRLPQPQQQQVRRRIAGKQAPSEFEINMLNSPKEGILDINENSINSDQEGQIKNFNCLKISNFSRHRFKVTQRKKSRKPSKRSSSHPVVQITKRMIQNLAELLSREEQAEVIESGLSMDRAF